MGRCAGVGALLLIFGLDWATESAPVQHLYYVPIILAGFRFKMRGGVAAAVAAILLYHIANPHLLTFRYGEPDLVQIALFLAVGMTTARLARDSDRMRRLAMTDDLTGLHNLRSFEAQLAMMVRAARKTEVQLALLVLDVDRLKSLNEQYGHLAGAEAVRTVGQIIGRRLPPTRWRAVTAGTSSRSPSRGAHSSAFTLSQMTCVAQCMTARRCLPAAPLLLGHCLSASAALARQSIGVRRPEHWPPTLRPASRCSALPT